MAVHKSTQMAATAEAPNDPSEAGGRVRMAMFEFTVPSGGAAVNDTVELCKIPAGARVVGGREDHDAMSSGAGTATVSIGVSGNATKYMASTSVDAAGQNDFANTDALGMLSKTTAEETIIATVGGEDWAASGVFKGYMLYVLD